MDRSIETISNGLEKGLFRGLMLMLSIMPLPRSASLLSVVAMGIKKGPRRVLLLRPPDP